MHFNPGPHFLKNLKMIKQTQNHVVLWVQILEMIISMQMFWKNNRLSDVYLTM